MTDSTLLSEMNLPDEVVEKALKAFWHHNGTELASMYPAIRAALQAMVDCGRAKVGDLDTGWGSAEGPWAPFAGKTCLIIRFSPQRKEKEQT